METPSASFRIISLAFLSLHLSSDIVSTGQTTYTVDPSGGSQYTTIQSAVDAAPSNSQTPTTISIAAATYKEKLTVNTDKINLVFRGQGYATTSVEWSDTANSTGSTENSATVSILADNFAAYGISFKNGSPPPKNGEIGGQGVALRVSGDKALFNGCGFYGSQDTLLDEQGRHYYNECYIEGSIDFIFGNAKSFYQTCTIHSIADKPANEEVTGSIAAQSRNSADEDTGFAFVDCVIDGTGRIWLARAWSAYSTVIFSRTYMSEVIAPQGWNDWNNPDYDKFVFFAVFCDPFTCF